MLGRFVPLLIPPLLLVVMSLVASPAQAQTWGSTVNVSNTRSDSGAGPMAVSGTNVHVLWSDGKGKGILYSRSTDSGATFSGPIQIFSSSASISAGHTIAASGTSVYVARGGRPSNNSPAQIYVRRSTNNGASFDAQLQVSNATGNPGVGNFNGMTAVGNTVHIIWTEWTGQWQVFYTRSTNNGTTFSAPIQLSATVGVRDGLSNVDLVADGTNVHVAWTDYLDNGRRAVYYIRSTDGGATFPAAGRIEVSDNLNDVTATNVFSHLAASGNNVYLVWKAHGLIDLQAYVFFARSIDAGASFSYPVSLSGAGSEVLGLAASGDDVHVIWGATSDIFYTRSHDTGVNWSAAVNISAGHSVVTSAPAPQIDASGTNAYITWTGGPSTAGDVFMRHSATGGDSFDGIDLSFASGGHSGGPQVIAAPGEVHVLWGDSSLGNSEVFYRHGTVP